MKLFNSKYDVKSESGLIQSFSDLTKAVDFARLLAAHRRNEKFYVYKGQQLIYEECFNLESKATGSEFLSQLSKYPDIKEHVCNEWIKTLKTPTKPEQIH